MMMTCRLLCALLVLALCCCRSLCVAQDSEKVQVPDATLTPTGSSSSSKEGGQAKGQSGPSALPVTKPAEKPGEDAGAGQRLTGASPKSDEAASELQEQGNKGTRGLQGDTNKSAGETDQDAEASAQINMTTTTTQAPTTTTTTSAPEAPINTAINAEAQSTTTTRAPSRLREVDGSLSSSAWVCASLLLAASALAYTTLG
ncbi:putative mucin TcMUCII [Trypanosoma cruzi]|nr:putative mucin TcMUCII [Trypanosoma cruzi]